MGFRSYVRHFRGAILGLLCPSKFVAAAKGKRSQKNHFLSVSEVTLGIFGVQFWRFSVLQRHGVSLRGGDFFHGVFPSEDQQQQQQKPLQQQAEKVARIHSSSKRKKKQPKSSFHHHFLWVSEVTLGICREVIFSMVCSHPRTSSSSTEADKKVGTGRLLLLCMPYRSAAHAAIGLFVFALDSPKFFGALEKWFFPWCFPIWGPDVKVAKIHSSSKRKKEPRASFSMGFRSYVRHFRGAIFSMVFSHPGTSTSSSSKSLCRSRRKR